MVTNDRCSMTFYRPKTRRDFTDLISALNKGEFPSDHLTKCFTSIELQITPPVNYVYKTVLFFSFQNNPKNLDLSYKTDLDLWDCLGRVKPVLQQNCVGLI